MIYTEGSLPIISGLRMKELKTPFSKKQTCEIAKISQV
jgi:hypothetical protein